MFTYDKLRCLTSGVWLWLHGSVDSARQTEAGGVASRDTFVGATMDAGREDILATTRASVEAFNQSVLLTSTGWGAAIS